ncbi:lethal(3)malignant brain tumor-like protein 2 [Pollicipes pollicipes]|uniref:lethal(3)malignant brain tumor-like protein 2 n=1 Tax=Pollicipes pollicipes TaxID=41117 RepID=UPI00188562A5|nr:lethal(3)malignant brain tumor-like protein 2 [Pollicipes pollicipes]
MRDPTFTAAPVQGYRGLVRFEGMGNDASRDRWVDLCSEEVKPRLLVQRLIGTRTLPDDFHRKVVAGLSSQLAVGQTVEVVDKSCISQVHPVGWARAVGHRLSAPDDYLARCETGSFLPADATQDCLPAPPPITHEGFKVRMKLEALDPLNLGSIGVATVMQVLGNHFLMVRLESLPPEPGRADADWFCYHASSPYIFPPGFCRTVGVALTPPHGHAADTFSWEAYLASQPGAQAAPPGQRLEAVDLMDPQLVCVATVAAVVGRLLRIHFDGWEERFDQWVDASSPDIFPVGWCRLEEEEDVRPPPTEKGDRRPSSPEKDRHPSREEEEEDRRPSPEEGEKDRRPPEEEDAVAASGEQAAEDVGEQAPAEAQTFPEEDQLELELL